MFPKSQVMNVYQPFLGEKREWRCVDFTCQGLPAGHQPKNISAGLDFLTQAVLALLGVLQFCMRTYLFQGPFLCWWKLCLRDGLKPSQEPKSPASASPWLHLFFVYRVHTSQRQMGWERSSTFPHSTSCSGTGPWRLQPQVSIKWYIINVPRCGFAGKTQHPYFNSISFQNGNLLATSSSFPVKTSHSQW